MYTFVCMFWVAVFGYVLSGECCLLANTEYMVSGREQVRQQKFSLSLLCTWRPWNSRPKQTVLRQ
jgi:hypothetical protein